MSEPPLRIRVANHAQSLRTDNNQTVLSTKAKELQNQNVKHDIKYHLIENKNSYTPEQGRCNLCIAEIYHIIYGNYENLLNSKNEIAGKCRHNSKFKFGNV